MTLRESVQSLLHNPFHAALGAKSAPGAHKGKRHKHTSKFIPSIALCSTLLTATIMFALSFITEFSNQFGPKFSNGVAQFAPMLSSGFESEENYFSSRQFRTKNDPTNDGNIDRNIGRNIDQITGEVIVEPFGARFDPRLKKLTANQNSNVNAPFEIPLTNVLDLLSLIGDESISISPGLKFYPTNKPNIIRACPAGADPFARISSMDRNIDGNIETRIQNACFTIKTPSIQPTAVSSPRVL